MGNKMKKLICSLLATAMLVTSVGVVAIAAPEDETTAADTTVTETVADDASTADQTDEEKEAADTDTTAEATEAPAPEATEAPVVTAASDNGSYENDDYYKKALTLDTALGIISGYEDGSVRPESKVTRAEMASIVLRMLNLSGNSTYKNIFTDVDASHWAAGQIQSAYEAGIVNGMGDGTFAPDSEVTYAQVIVMLVNAMNYTNDAEYYGGWQQGYIKTAGDIGLLKNASGSADVASDRGVVIKMVYNALLNDYNNPTSYDAYGNPKYENDKTLAEVKFDVIEKKGILEGTAKTTILTNTDIQDGQIAIKPDDGTTTTYDTELTGLEDYLAQKVTYYYKENSGLMPEVLAVTYDASKTETFDIDDPDDIEENGVKGFENGNGTIKIQGVGKAKNCAGATIIYNGKVLTNAQLNEIGDDINDMLKPELGSLKLVKSDKSNDNYDIIFVDSYETVIVASASATRLQGNISAGTDDNIGAKVPYSLNLDDSEDRTITVTKGGSEIRLRNLKQDDVANIKRSYDNTVVDIIVADESITGTATGVTKKLHNSHATVNGTKYDVADIAVDKLKTGSQSVFHLDAFGRIVYIEASTADGKLQSGEKYGWIMQAYNDDKGDYVVKIMTTDGTAKEYAAGTNLDYWGPTDTKSSTKTGDAVESTIKALMNGSFLKSGDIQIRLVKFKVNTNDTLTRLYCAVDATALSEDDAPDALRIDPTNLTGKAVSASLVGGYKINDGILEIRVPKDTTEMKDAANYKFGEVSASTYVVRENGASRDFVVGEFEDGNVPTVLIYFTAASDALADITDIDTASNKPLMVVDEIDTGVDDDDNVIYTIHGYTAGAEVSVTTTKNTVFGKSDPYGGKDRASIIADQGGKKWYPTTNSSSTIWDARNGATDGSTKANGAPKELTDYLHEGDIILCDGGEKIILFVAAEDVYNQVINGLTDNLATRSTDGTGGVPIGHASGMNTRNQMSFGYLEKVNIGSRATITTSASSLNVMEFDNSKIMDTIEINNKTGNIQIDKNGSEGADLIVYDDKYNEGDVVFARFADKGGLQEVIVYRFVD